MSCTQQDRDNFWISLENERQLGDLINFPQWAAAGDEGFYSISDAFEVGISDSLDIGPIWLIEGLTYIFSSHEDSVMLGFFDMEGCFIEEDYRLAISNVSTDGWYYLLALPTEDYNASFITAAAIVPYQEPLPPPVYEPDDEILEPESAGPFFIDPDGYLSDNDINRGNGIIIHAEAAQLYRAYMGGMGRLPDDAGFQWWFDQIKSGDKTLRSMADGFIHSTEFKGYADTNNDNQISNDEFVTHMYEGVFGRAPDTEGYEYWTGKLDSGDYSQPLAFTFMTQSNEYVEQTLEVVADYIFI